MSSNLKPEGKIGLNQDWAWVVDEIVLKAWERLELRIGGHWILGLLIEQQGQLYWSAWIDHVIVPINFGINARWPGKG